MINHAHQKAWLIAAAGNENRNAASYPARYPHVICAALDAKKPLILTLALGGYLRPGGGSR